MGMQLPLKGAQTPIFGPCPLWPNGWMDQDATWYGGRHRPRRHCVRWGPSSPPQKGAEPRQFLAHVYCGQTAGWVTIPLCMEVTLSPGHIVFNGNPVPPKRVTVPNFRPMSVVAKRLPISATAEHFFAYAKVEKMEDGIQSVTCCKL